MTIVGQGPYPSTADTGNSASAVTDLEQGELDADEVAAVVALLCSKRQPRQRSKCRVAVAVAVAGSGDGRRGDGREGPGGTQVQRLR